ncbi:imidazole glycerol phosphate synthase subunit HisH [Sphingomonas kaistensis]|uniref:Imidazole glycerol phosphate synthase subunit HisH n=1 Tax=Sphingomonas kaistensis TaxID=298708 RepID=A0ABZ2G3R8_9SPHN
MNVVTLVDLGYGNLGSIETALRRLGTEVRRTSEAAGITGAERLLLPGVGAAGFAMQRIASLGLAEALRGFAGPALGICLGMHLLFERSEEGDVALLGLLPGDVRKMTPSATVTIPHMGWSKIETDSAEIGLTSGDYVYFAHSYAAPDGPSTIARAHHGIPVPAVVRSDNWTGAQFHPERSGPVGARFLEAWLTA